ncbi:(deoxy)nucleoside triphosphate pyrophosphohydrolase [Virgibacillus sp. 179-BFC.A HS]|uniref:8-oxo-dGTP diphosphatase n=1 Tax=Tigheibacillus jepli TaxID=3035914 RepID=A0ABU5CL51_9BACI|nr:(deoxy)nucleoside triphosphate pyrophosphohydrolase [Virgibacillus sp. 179-BFC.A HS]MDY0407056.1 (deoxy)nucleoside triphosphate pyrophosphohydrolase [Virgibacillus sp. 179-BFC.A HS]
MKKAIQVVGAIIMKNNRILCTQRGPSKDLAYKWEFPGGKIEKGESAQAALKREIQEELKCTIEIVGLVEQTVHQYEFAIVHLTTFLCKLMEVPPTLTEHMALKWLKPNELLSLDWAPADLPAVKRCMQLF